MSASPASPVKSQRDYSQNSYNKMGMFTFFASMVASLGVLIYVAFLSGGIDLKEVQDVKAGEKAPVSSGPAAAPAAAPAATPAPAPLPNAKGASNALPQISPQHSSQSSPQSSPWISSPEAIARGKDVFAQNCVSCHGKDGLGNGPAGENLSPRPRNLVDGHWKFGGTRFGLMQVLANGSPGTAMQSYAYLALNDRWSLVHYVRSITKNQIADNDADVASQAASLN